jgi:hypothetical protein
MGEMENWNWSREEGWFTAWRMTRNIEFGDGKEGVEILCVKVAIFSFYLHWELGFHSYEEFLLRIYPIAYVNITMSTFIVDGFTGVPSWDILS